MITTVAYKVQIPCIAYSHKQTEVEANQVILEAAKLGKRLQDISLLVSHFKNYPSADVQQTIHAYFPPNEYPVYHDPGKVLDRYSFNDKYMKVTVYRSNRLLNNKLKNHGQ